MALGIYLPNINDTSEQVLSPNENAIDDAESATSTLNLVCMHMSFHGTVSNVLASLENAMIPSETMVLTALFVLGWLQNSPEHGSEVEGTNQVLSINGNLGICARLASAALGFPQKFHAGEDSSISMFHDLRVHSFSNSGVRKLVANTAGILCEISKKRAVWVADVAKTAIVVYERLREKGKVGIPRAPHGSVRVAREPNAIDKSANLHAKHLRAYCALLHGAEDHFFIYALIVGLRLKMLSGETDRVLLCDGRWWHDQSARAALSRVYTSVRHIRLIHAPHASFTPRHNEVFSKIKAFRLPYRYLVLLDLDLVPRADLSPLFDIPAPAGMHHGECRSEGDLVHGQFINEDGSDGRWCINTGVMRLDPCQTRLDRRREVASMVAEIRRIRHRSWLPEQNYLVQKLKGWRHIDPMWNTEVGPLYVDPGFTWPRAEAREASKSSRSLSWRAIDLGNVRVFHFSGTKSQPWCYIDLDPHTAYNDAATQWKNSDPRCLIATAIYEWRLALEDVVTESAQWSCEERQLVEEIIGRLRDTARAHREWSSHWSSRPQECHHCKKWFPNAEGRWLLGWEGWWLCTDCIVGYVLTDEAPESPCCEECGSVGHGWWSWASGKPCWYCKPCWRAVHDHDAHLETHTGNDLR